MNYNKWIFGGRLTRDVALSHLPSGTAVAEFGMASNRKWRGKDGEQREDVCFVDVRAFGKQAEVLNQYVKKGSSLLVDGVAKFDSWTAKDGTKRSKLYLVVSEFQFIGTREASDENQTHSAPAVDATDVPPVGDDIPFVLAWMSLSATFLMALANGVMA